MRILVAGSSGLIGTALVDGLRAAGHDVVALVRRVPAVGEVQWEPGSGELAEDALDGVDAVVNLAGAGIGDRRWSESYKRELRASRLDTTTLLSTAIAARSDRPSVMLSASAVGWYGDRGDEELTEASEPGRGFLAELCRDWEAATGAASAAGVRVAHLRTGIVLSRHGGALRKQLPLFRLALGGRFGSGRQWQSWISIDDEVAAIEHILAADVEGPVNLVSPAPVTNAVFTRTLASVLRRPAVVPVPRFGPALLLGRELAGALLYAGQRVLPTVLEASGFRFTHGELEPALRAILQR